MNGLRREFVNEHGNRIFMEARMSPLETTPLDKLIERVARAISVPEHHAGWEHLSATEQDLYRMQADYALKELAINDTALERAVEALTRFADKNEQQAKCLEGYAVQYGFGVGPPLSTFHLQAMHFRDIAKEARETLSLIKGTKA